jgi:hypothetical protein
MAAFTAGNTRPQAPAKDSMNPGSFGKFSINFSGIFAQQKKMDMLPVLLTMGIQLNMIFEERRLHTAETHESPLVCLSACAWQ